jgi:hypothetical protein
MTGNYKLQSCRENKYSAAAPPGVFSFVRGWPIWVRIAETRCGLGRSRAEAGEGAHRQEEKNSEKTLLDLLEKEKVRRELS